VTNIWNHFTYKFSGLLESRRHAMARKEIGKSN
jgi:hypothetical protein